MKKIKKEESSSSEDEASIQAFKEAADVDFLKQSFFISKAIESNAKDNTDKNSNAKNQSEDCSTDQYPSHGLSETCKEFIAKKLNDRLNMDIVLEDTVVPACTEKPVCKEISGIRLFASSNAVITNIDTAEQPKPNKKRKADSSFNDKLNIFKCKEVAIDSEKILSQYETKYWTNRKLGKQFKYKKLKNGTLLEIK